MTKNGVDNMFNYNFCDCDNLESKFIKLCEMFNKVLEQVEIPTPTQNDNGKFLSVVNGKYTLITVINSEVNKY